HFIPVAADEWALRRQVDEEGEFFNRVADQGPLKRGGSRQGIYAMSAGGRFLFHAWGDVSPDGLRQKLREALRSFNALPPKERAAGLVQVAERIKLDPEHNRTPPAGTLILNVYSRPLARKGDALCACDERVVLDNKISVPVLSAYDHVWITEPEWKAMFPAKAKKGDTLPLPPIIAKRIARFHLVDNTRGEPGYWKEKEIQKSDLSL